MSDQPKHAGKHSEACQSGFPDHDCPICGSSLPKPYALGECDSVIDKRPFNRSLSPKPTGEWTAREMSNGEWCVEFDAGNGAVCVNELNAKAFANAHNAALAAEQENTRRWAIEAHDSAKSEQQLREQLAAVKQQIKDALAKVEK